MAEKFKYKICKILTHTDDGIIIDFEGFGIFFKETNNKSEVKVRYKGEIGKSNFRIELM